MLKKLLSIHIAALYPYKYWIVLLSLLVVGLAYHKVDKSSEYLSGLEFVNYGDGDLFNLKVGDEVIYEGRTSIMNETRINNLYERYIRYNNAGFITLASSKASFYEFLLGEREIKGNKEIVGNYLIRILNLSSLAKLEANDISKLSLAEKISLQKLYDVIQKNLILRAQDELGNFTLTAKSKNRELANFLPIAFYEHLIVFFESENYEQLLKDYAFYGERNNSLEHLYSVKEIQLWSLKDKYKSLTGSSNIIDYQILENDLVLLEQELDLSRAYLSDAQNRIQNNSSQFYLINRLFVPIEYRSNWFNDFLLLSLGGILLCFGLCLAIISIKSLELEGDDTKLDLIHNVN